MAPEKNESESHKLVNNVSSPCELCGSRSQIPNLKYFLFAFPEGKDFKNGLFLLHFL